LSCVAASPRVAGSISHATRRTAPHFQPPANRIETQTRSELPILKTGLELQAVSWAPSAADRMAVINGSIIREGGSIEGYFVVRIEADEVIVRKDLSDWRLVFNLKK